jgi:hypothetical protein
VTAPTLPAALRAGADGTYTLAAAAGLVIAHAAWLDREDFVKGGARQSPRRDEA